MRTCASVALGLVLAQPIACGGGASGRVDSGGLQDSSGYSQCADSCFQHRWWIDLTSGDCSVFCMGSAQYPECAQSDCLEVSAANRYDAGRASTLSPLLFSAKSRSFYLLGSLMTDTYAVGAGCSLQVDMRTPSTFACSGDTLTFSVGTFTAATAQQSTALDAAAASNTIGDYTY